MASIAERVGRQRLQRLVVGHAAWWIPTPNGNPNAIRDEEVAEQKLSFAAALKDLLENLSFHCYGKLVEHGRRMQERFVWLICHITALGFLIAFVWGTYKHAAEELVTTIYNPSYPVCHVALPAISVCSNNRISKRAVWRYAHELSLKDPRLRNATYFYDELQAFGMFYTLWDFGDYERFLRLQGFLDVLDTKSDELFYNTRERLRDLTPKCSDILLSCRFAAHYFNCEKVFVKMLTSYGYCCTLNPKGDFLKDYTYYKRFFGADMGLVLTLNATTSDNFYKMHEQDGFSTVHEARHMSPTVRKCRFWDEMPYNFTNHYTHSKCISACRARSIYNLCGCLPFQMPHRFITQRERSVYCTLQHMECIRRYKFKWLNVITSREYVPGLEHELQDALYCPNCLPSCTEIRYQVRGAMTLPINGLYKPMTNSNSNGNSSSGVGVGVGHNSYGHDSSELAVVRIYFAETHIQYFRQIIKNAWYEIFSTIGNICSIIAGFSLIGICELLFFLAKQLWHAYKAEQKSELSHTHTHTQSHSQSSTRTHTQTQTQTQTRANGRAKATQQRQHQHQEQEQQQQHQHQPMELLILP
ncbi:GH16433 [Drosophila grimshawi]|uniref:GH16433 n=1 Tax=Drosophila grimshawi TaxID=7222 RepID=B4JU75_DROGR|nr:GH16433 [Drosophila grimshawi]